MSIPETVDGDQEQGHDARSRETLLKIHEEAAAYFREMLTTPAGARARQQLADRDVTQETIDQLGLGFAPNSRDGLKSRLLQKGFPQPLLLQSGLILQRDESKGGDVIDRFRTLIEARHRRTDDCAFGGRAMDADRVPKYLNSPETPIYSKGRTLYGLNLSKGAIRKVGFVVLVEGYFDFAQVFKSEAAPVVASCGTALTTQQAQLLRRFTTKIVLSFDPDAYQAPPSDPVSWSPRASTSLVVLDKGEDPYVYQAEGPDGLSWKEF
jgi:DNA primase